MADPDDSYEDLLEASDDDLALPLEALDPVDPPASLRQRIMQSIAQGGRLHRFADALSDALDVSVERAKALLDRVDDLTEFVPSLPPQATIFHVEGGPRVAAAITGFIRMAPGSVFPPHTHEGDELVLVVQGRLREDDGTEAGPGEIRRRPPGSTHSFEVLPGPDLVYLAVLFDGLRIGETVVRPGDSGI